MTERRSLFGLSRTPTLTMTLTLTQTVAHWLTLASYLPPHSPCMRRSDPCRRCRWTHCSLSLPSPPPPPLPIEQVLNDATERVKEKSCYALEAFCENLGAAHSAPLPAPRQRILGLFTAAPEVVMVDRAPPFPWRHARLSDDRNLCFVLIPEEPRDAISHITESRSSAARMLAPILQLHRPNPDPDPSPAYTRANSHAYTRANSHIRRAHAQ